MTQRKPQSRPEPAKPAPAPGKPAAPEDVYGGVWGSSGEHNDEDLSKAFPPVQISFDRTQK